MEKTTYLGDSVYAEHTDFGIELFLNNGERGDPGVIEKKNLIFLEPQTLTALFRFAMPALDGVGIVEDSSAKAIIEQSNAEISKQTEAQNIAMKIANLLTGYEGRKDFSLCGNSVDFSHYTREEITPLMQHLKGGKWERSASYDGQHLDYVNKTLLPAPYTIRFWAGEPPPTCRIVEEEVFVPEQIVTTPAHTEKRRKIVCSKPEEETTATTESNENPNPAA